MISVVEAGFGTNLDPFRTAVRCPFWIADASHLRIDGVAGRISYWQLNVKFGVSTKRYK